MDNPDVAAIGERVEQLLGQLRATSDDRGWAGVEELVRLLTDLYGAGLVLAVELGGPELLRQLAADELGSSLLLLHGLHPDDLEGRVRRAVEKLTPGVRKGGADVFLEAVAGGDVRLVLTTSGGCGSTAEAIKDSIANAVWDAAPDAASVDVRMVVDAKPSTVPIRLGPTRKVAVGGGP